MSSVCSAVQTIKSGDGSQTQFSFDFPYVFKTEIHVYFWNVTTKEYDEILTTDSTYPWQVPSANPTIVEFTGTAPPAPSDATANIKIRRITNIDDIQALFNPGSAIRSDDLNSNFEQLRFAVQESLCPDITEAEVVTYLQNYYWNNFEDTVTSTDTWDSSDTKIATTAAMDARFQDELSETITSTETWPNDDNTIATTAAIDDQIDNAITNDILIDSTGLTKSSSGGQTTLGIGAGSVDLDRIKSDDIVETSAYSSTWTNEDDKVATAGALAARHDVVVNTDVNPPTTTQTGKQWLSTAPGNQVHKIYDGSGWRTVAVGQPFSPATTTVVRYVDVTNGSDASDVTGFLPQAPLQSIGRALELINASSSGDGSLIKVAPGVYQETLPLRIKKNNISIVGESMRSCFVHPTVATENNDMFEVDSGSYIANLTLLGLKVPTADQGSRNNSIDNDATYGLPSNQPFSVRFRTDVQPVILKSPYIQNCTHFSDAHFDNANFDPNTFPSTDAQTYSAVAGDQTSAPCGGGLLVDGSAVSSSSPIRSMVVDAFTQITLDGPGILVTNNGYAQLVSFFGTFAHYHAKAKNGGQINLSNCVSDFGRYGLIADGKSPSAIATATANAASSGATTITIGAITTAGSFHGTVSRPLDHMMVTIDGVDYGVVSSTANGAGWDIVLTSGLTSNITNTTVSFALRSYISTGGHTFEFVGVGTDYSDHPDNGGVPIEANQVIELNGGKVWQSSTDHVGKFKAGDVLVVDQVSETVDLKDTTVTGNITVTGTVDGRDVATDGTKLDGIAAGAIANVVEDTTPQLGGNLDVNGNDIVSVSNGDIDFDPNGSGVVVFKGNSTKGSGQFKLNCEQNSHGITIKGPPHSAAASYTLTLPNTDGSANEVLKTDGSGNLSWAAQTSGYSDSSVDAHLNQSTAASGEVLSWNGSDYDWVAQAAGGATDSISEGNTSVECVDTGIDGHITFDTEGSEVGRFDNSGNFGVGETSPATSGFGTAIRVKGSTGVGGLFAEGSSGNAWFGFYSGNSTSDTPALLYPSNGAIRLGTTSSVGTAGFSEKARVDSSGRFLINGTTATSTRKLEVFSSDVTFYDVRVGRGAGAHIYSTVVGGAGLNNNTTGTNNTSIGYASMYQNTTGAYGTALGVSALTANTTGNNNTAIGYQAGNSITTGSNNTVIGYDADASSATASNEITLGNASVTSLRIPGLQSGATDGQVLTYNATNGNITLASAGGGTSIVNSNNLKSTILGELGSLTSGVHNIALGASAGTSLTTAGYTVNIGNSAGYGNTASENIFIGLAAGYSGAGSSGSDKIGIGASALRSVTTGYSVVAVGRNAGYSLTTGRNSVLIGHGAGHNVTTGYDNVYLGYNTGYNQTGSNRNVAIGESAMYGSGTGASSENVAIGYYSGKNLTTGNYNTLLGKEAGRDITTGSSNTLLGKEAGATLTTQTRNTYVGYESGRYQAGTGSTDNTGIGYSALKGSVGALTGTNNTAVGYLASRFITTANSTCTLGWGAGGTLTTGADNVLLGVSAGYSISVASGNVCVGKNAGNSITTGSNNTVIGYDADASSATASNEITLGNASITSLRIPGLQSGATNGQVLTYNSTNGNITLADGGATDIDGLSDGYANTTTGSVGLGTSALGNENNISARRNTATGEYGLTSLTSGYYNVANGFRSLNAVTTGYGNVGIGFETARHITTGYANTALGRGAGYAITTGGFNTCLGREAGDNITTGTNNICIGNGADASTATMDNEITLGNTSISTLRCNTQTISSLSDGRDKTEVEDLPLGLDFINTLRPVKFKWDTRDGNGKDGSYEAGFIAQDLQSAQSTSDAEYLKMVMDENPDRLEARYGQLIPVLVQAIKDLKSEIETLKSNA